MDAGFLARKGVLTRHPVDFFPERCARGTGVVPFDNVHFGFVALFNDDPLGRMIRVYGLNSEGAFNLDQDTIYVFQGKVGSFAMQGFPLVANQGSMPGSIYTGYATTKVGQPIGVASFELEQHGASSAPLIILPTHFSLIMYSLDSSSTVAADFLWMID